MCCARQLPASSQRFSAFHPTLGTEKKVLSALTLSVLTVELALIRAGLDGSSRWQAFRLLPFPTPNLAHYFMNERGQVMPQWKWISNLPECMAQPACLLPASPSDRLSPSLPPYRGYELLEYQQLSCKGPRTDKKQTTRSKRNRHTGSTKTEGFSIPHALGVTWIT